MPADFQSETATEAEIVTFGLVSTFNNVQQREDLKFFVEFTSVN
jgi:hypothetical protein